MSDTYTKLQRDYICSVDGNAHQSAVTIIGTLEGRIAELERENAPLRDKLDALPKTADGAAIAPGMKIWLRIDDPIGGRECEVLEFRPGFVVIATNQGPDAADLCDVFSTREAAEAAARESK